MHFNKHIDKCVHQHNQPKKMTLAFMVNGQGQGASHNQMTIASMSTTVYYTVLFG